MHAPLEASEHVIGGPAEAPVPDDAVADDGLVRERADAFHVEPQPEQQAGLGLARSRCVRGPAVQHGVVVDELHVARPYLELEAVLLGQVVDEIEQGGVLGREAVAAIAFERPDHPMAVVAARHPSVGHAEERHPITGRRRLARVVFVLAVPDEAVIQALELVGCTFEQHVVERGRAGQPAGRRVGGLANAEQTDAVGQVHVHRHFARVAHPAGALAWAQGPLGHVVQQAAIAVLGHSLAEVCAEAPVHELDVLPALSRDGEPVQQGEAAAVAEAGTDRVEHRLTAREREVVGGDPCQGQAARVRVCARCTQLVGLRLGQGEVPGRVTLEVA